MNAAGNWLTDSAPSMQQLQGRYEPNTKSQLVTAQDGKQVHYSGIVYGQFDAVGLGITVEVKDGAITIAKGNVISFSKGQLNSRLWLE